MNMQTIKIIYLMFVALALALSFANGKGRINLDWWLIWFPVYALPIIAVSFAIYRSIVFRIWGKKNLKKETTKNTEI